MRSLLSIALAVITWWVLPAKAETLILAIPSNLTADARGDVNDVIGGIYDREPPGSRLIVVDASRQVQIADVTWPAEATTKRAKAKVLGSAFQKIYDFTASTDPAARPNDLNIPQLLRFIGSAVLPGVDGHQAHVMLLGSLIFDNPHDAGFNFREFVPSDGMLVKLNTIFNISGHEHLLDGALIGLCFTDRSDIRETKESVHRDSLAKFWGKTLTGQGAKVSVIMPLSPACADRLLADTVSTENYTINRNDKPALIRNSWIKVDTRNQ